jgi:hypothetical protein
VKLALISVQIAIKLCKSHFVISLDNLAKVAVENNLFGHVIAVFDSSIYVQITDKIVCLGNKSLKNSPITIITSLPENFSFKTCKLKIEEKVSFFDRNIRIQNTTFAIDEKTKIWHPAETKYPFMLDNVRQGIRYFHKILQHKDVEPRGLSEILFFKNLNVKELNYNKKVLSEISECKRWICQSLVKKNRDCMSRPYWSENLLGLGFGLTPSGDDFIGGVMIGLHICKKVKTAQCIWRHVYKNISYLTTPIAGAHLYAASTGLGPGDIHKLADAILSANAEGMAELVKSLDMIGHTSGWDIFAGVYIVIEALSTQSSFSEVNPFLWV